jgi:hypothetical protein
MERLRIAREFLKSRTATAKEKQWMAAITDLGCVICKREMGLCSPPEIHHLNGKVKPDCHLKSIPLCYQHHREGSDNALYTSRHPSKARFEKRYGSEQSLLDCAKEFLNWD